MKRLGSWLFVGSLLGCAGEDVVLVTVQNGGASAQGGATSGGASQGGTTFSGGTAQGGAAQGGTAGASSGGNTQSGGTSSMCRSNADCDAGFCEKASCADELGHCERRDVFCEGQKLAPVCGCDNVTYFNDCWRRQTGVPLKSATECKDQLSECDRSMDCPNGAMCARLFAFGDRCPPGRGMCWSGPETCDSITDAPSFIECGPTPGRCVDMCTAIHLTGHPFTRAPAPCSQL